MLSTEVENSINTLFRDARDKHHEFVTVEHLLLAMPVSYTHLTLPTTPYV